MKLTMVKYNLIFLALFLLSKINAQKKAESEEKKLNNPEPKLVVPGNFSSAPSDAVVLFDGKDFSRWQHSKTKQPVKWLLNSDKSMTIKPGTGSIETKEEHGSVQLHIEWKSPIENKGEGQTRGNSGIIFQARYEVQVLNSYLNSTYPDGQAGSIYSQHVPLVNAMRPTGEWQVYDIIFNSPKYDDNGEIIKPGSFIVLHNGIIIQNAVKINSPTLGIEKGTRKVLILQDHDKNGKVSYRNIWMRKI